jgi:hypothetical protein
MATKWVTKERPRLSGTACPWLIRRFVDPEAEIIYVPPDQVLAVAEREGATPFDTPGAELTRHGDRFTFDAFVKKYRPDDPAMQALAEIMQRVTPEWPGLMAIGNGMRQFYDERGQDDQAQLEAIAPVFDALYAFCKRQVEQAKGSK